MFPGFRSSSGVQGVFLLNPVHTEHHKEILKSVSFTSLRGLWSNPLNSSVWDHQIGRTSMGVRSLLRSAGTGPWIRNTGSSFSSRQHVGRDTRRLILNIATWEPPCAEVESIIRAWGRKIDFLCLPSSLPSLWTKLTRQMKSSRIMLNYAQSWGSQTKRRTREGADARPHRALWAMEHRGLGWGNDMLWEGSQEMHSEERLPAPVASPGIKSLRASLFLIQVAINTIFFPF